MYNAYRQSSQRYDSLRRHDLYRRPLTPLRFQEDDSSLVRDYRDAFVEKKVRIHPFCL